MGPIKIFALIRRRRLAIFGFATGLIVIAAVVISANFFNKSKTALAADFLASSDKLVVPANSFLYIGAEGYVSQRAYSSVGEPYNADHFLSTTFPVSPSDRVWNVNYKSITCPDPAIWGDASYSAGCFDFLSDGAGMILKYNQSIDIYGTVVIGDRVALDAPNITLHSGGKIFANGQNSELGFGDNCGAGGAGGENGGVLTSTTDLSGSHPTDAPAGLEVLSCPDSTGGATPINQYFTVGGLLSGLNSVNKSVANYFTSNGSVVSGGNGQSGGVALQGGYSGGGGGSALTGVGAGGGSGPSGWTNGGYDHGGSGGAGGGFGLVFQANTLNIYNNAKVTAAGGDSEISTNGDPQTAGHADTTAGGFGGAGGGGVIIINSISVNFYAANSDSSPTPVPADYSLFNVSGGQFNPLPAFPKFDYNFAPGFLAGAPANYLYKAGDGKLILNVGSGVVSIKKTITNITAGADRPNYVFAPGDQVQIKLQVFNLVPGQTAEIKDDIFSDGLAANTPTVLDKGGGSVSGSQIVWDFTATASSQTFTYTIQIN